MLGGGGGESDDWRAASRQHGCVWSKAVTVYERKVVTF